MRNAGKLFLFLLLPFGVFAQKNPGDEYMRGLAFFRNAQNDSALHYFNHAWEKDKNNPDIAYYRGLTLMRKGETDLAMPDLQKVESAEKGRASFYLAQIMAMKGDLENTLRYLDINLQSAYKVPEKDIFLDPAMAKFEKDPAWTGFWKEAKYYTAFDALLAEADFLASTGAYVEAINLLSEGLKKAYRKAPLYARRAEIYLSLKNERLALEDMNSAIEADKKNPGLFFKRAELNYRLGKYKPALDDYQSALKLKPDMLEAYPGKALALNKNGMTEQAVTDFDFYLKYQPGDAKAWFLYGNMHRENERLFDALSCYNKCLAISPDKAEYFLARGETYLRTRTYRYANNDFGMALDLDPTIGKAWYNKGLALIELGMKPEACDCFKKAGNLGIYEAYAQAERICK